MKKEAKMELAPPDFLCWGKRTRVERSKRLHSERLDMSKTLRESSAAFDSSVEATIE